MSWLLLLQLACTTGLSTPSESPRVAVAEAFDVPPPPQMRSLDIGPVEAHKRPGDAVAIEGVKLELVDARDVAGGQVWTVYVPEATAERWLAVGAVGAP